MIAEFTPMRWPAAWRAGSLETLRGTAINCVLTADLEVAAEARKRGLTAVMDGVPAGVAAVKGEWPGVRMSRSGGAAAGPTGTAWVNSNGWKVRLESALRPGTQVWVEAAPDAAMRLHADAYVVAFADSAAYGGRWVISLDDRLAAGIPAGDVESAKIWKQLTAAAGLFARYREWADYAPVATVGVVSDFAGANLFSNSELLNLLGRSGQQYRILPKSREFSCYGLRAVIYGDKEAPGEAVRRKLTDFVRGGGLLITGPVWGEAGEATQDEHPRYATRKLGSGRIAIWKAKASDPYVLANDTAVLVSHRYDLVRLWNAGSAGSFLTAVGNKAVAHLLFYANEGPDAASVRVAGKYTKARLATPDGEGLKPAAVEVRRNAIEVHLPPVPQYIALELEA